MKIYKYDAGHLTKMAAMPIYGKILQKSSFPQPAGRFPRNFVCSIEDSCMPIIVCSNDDPGLTLTYFSARSNFGFYIGKSEISGFFKSFCNLRPETNDFDETLYEAPEP